MSVEIKDCPFCGSDSMICEYRSDYSNDVFVRCQNCFCSTDDYKSVKEALEGWNNRVDNIVYKKLPAGLAKIDYEGYKCIITPYPQSELQEESDENN